MDEQHDWHVREWRMLRAQGFLWWGLFNDLRRFANAPPTS